MIEVVAATKVYGKKANVFTALKDVNFTIPTGASVAIVGKSGSGKSTLMHVMSGLDRLSSGQIMVNGKSLSSLKRKEMDRFRAQDMAFIFQAFFVEPNETCYQNVALPLEINEVPIRRRKKLVRQALERVELADKINQRAKNLSGGQKQRLAIARAIVNEPSIIFADEPTGNLDSATGDKLPSKTAKSPAFAAPGNRRLTLRPPTGRRKGPGLDAPVTRQPKEGWSCENHRYR
jgi:putative ABC transport system ATP-binding protein